MHLNRQLRWTAIFSRVLWLGNPSPTYCDLVIMQTCYSYSHSGCGRNDENPILIVHTFALSLRCLLQSVGNAGRQPENSHTNK